MPKNEISHFPFSKQRADVFAYRSVLTILRLIILARSARLDHLNSCFKILAVSQIIEL